MTFTIAGRELRNLLISPLGWGLLAVVQLVQGLVFYRLVQTYLLAPAVTGPNPGATYHIVSLFFGSAAYVLLLAVPFLTMRLVSGEKRGNTWPLLMSAPVSAPQIVFGKYLGALAFLLLALCLLSLMPLSLVFAAGLDLGMIAAAFLGTALLVASYCAVGLLLSTLTAQPALAALGTLLVLLLFWLAEAVLGTGVPWLDALLAYLAFFQHFEPLLRGLVRTGDLAYYLLLALLALGLATLRVRGERVRA